MSLYHSLISQLNFFYWFWSWADNPYFLRFTTNWIVELKYLWALRNTVIISFVLFFLFHFLTSRLTTISNKSVIYIVIMSFVCTLSDLPKKKSDSFCCCFLTSRLAKSVTISNKFGLYCNYYIRTLSEQQGEKIWFLLFPFFFFFFYFMLNPSVTIF